MAIGSCDCTKGHDENILDNINNKSENLNCCLSVLSDEIFSKYGGSETPELEQVIHKRVLSRITVSNSDDKFCVTVSVTTMLIFLACFGLAPIRTRTSITPMSTSLEIRYEWTIIIKEKLPSSDSNVPVGFL